jgi:prepilin-type N-terminal cleavage/methylation domain-containing protein
MKKARQLVAAGLVASLLLAVITTASRFATTGRWDDSIRGFPIGVLVNTMIGFLAAFAFKGKAQKAMCGLAIASLLTIALTTVQVAVMTPEARIAYSPELAKLNLVLRQTVGPIILLVSLSNIIMPWLERRAGESGNHARINQKHGGFSLVEVLVVIVVITILAAALFAVFPQVRAASQASATTSNLRQLGTAIALYREDQGDLPRKGISGLVEAGLLTDRRILLSSGDPYSQGYANRNAECLSGLYPIAPFPSSVELSFASEGSGTKSWFDLVSEKEANPALAVVRVHGDRQFASSCLTVPMEYQGRLLQLKADGSVQQRTFIDISTAGDRQLCWPAMFADGPITDYCSRS